MELVLLSGDFGVCEMMEEMGEIFREFKKKSNEIKGSTIDDLSYSLRKKLLECLFLFASEVTDLSTFNYLEIKEIGVRIIQKYFGAYLF